MTGKNCMAFIRIFRNWAGGTIVTFLKKLGEENFFRKEKKCKSNSATEKKVL